MRNSAGYGGRGLGTRTPFPGIRCPSVGVSVQRGQLRHASAENLQAGRNQTALPTLVIDMVTLQRDYEALFREISPGLWRALFVYAGGRRDIADDSLSEAFARALRYGDGINTPKSWLYRTAFRLAADELRRSGEQDAAALVDREWQMSTDPVELVLALRELTPMQRTAVFLHYQVDLPVSVVAHLMGISAGAAKLHLFRGRRKLRDLLGAEEVVDD